MPRYRHPVEIRGLAASSTCIVNGFDGSAMDELLQSYFAVAEKDRLYRCLDRLLEHKQELLVWLRQKWADLFQADFEVLLYDLTSTSSKATWSRIRKRVVATAGRDEATARNW